MQSLEDRATATDWDVYYNRPYKTASVTRAITGALLIKQMRRFAVRHPSIAELGGANSCFFELIRKTIEPCEYHIFDNNQVGLDRFAARVGHSDDVRLHNQNILEIESPCGFDLVFSVGLIEHFDRDGTRQAIESHFDILKPGGVAIITFPTPTVLYRAVRRLAELSGLWIFNDERPLRLEEVESVTASIGHTLYRKLNWPIVLTQYVVVLRKT